MYPSHAGGIFVEVESGEAGLRILLRKRHVAEEASGEHDLCCGATVVNDPWVPAAAAVGAGDLRAYRPAGEEFLTAAHHAAVDFLQRSDLAGRETTGIVGAFGAFRKITPGTEIAAARIVDHAVLEPVGG